MKPKGVSAAKQPRGRRRADRLGDRLTRTQIAHRSKMDRTTVSKYLAMDGAPRADENMRYDYHAALEWIEKQAPRIASNSEEMRLIKESILRMEAEDRAIDLAVKRGQYVDKKIIEPTIAAFMTQLTEDLRMKFERELPSKYDGKSMVERQKMNADAIDWVIRRVKEGAAPIAT